MIGKSITSLAMIASCGLLAIGCSSTDSKNQNEASNRANLTRAASCEDLLAMLKADALIKMNTAIDREIFNAEIWGIPLGGYDGSSYPSGVPVSGSDWLGSEAGDSGGEWGSGTGVDDNNKATVHSDTNKQVADVDEADIVKTDGRYIYLLHGQAFLTINAWPASELSQQSSFAIEGTPLEMYVTDEGKVVVYSAVYGNAIYAAAGITRRNAYDDSLWNGDEYYTSPPNVGYYTNHLTKITVLSLDNAEPAIESEMYFEGYYTSSRRVGQFVRTVLQGASFGPSYGRRPDTYHLSSVRDYVAVMEQWREQNTAVINQSTIDDWLPYYMVRTDGRIEAHASACEDFYVPTAGTTQYGMTQIQSIDLATPHELPRNTSIMGMADTVYSNRETMVLATHAWMPWWDYLEAPAATGPSDGASEGRSERESEATDADSGRDPSTGTSSSALRTGQVVSTTYMHIHTFDLSADPSQPAYTASGTIPGYVKNQFSIDVDGAYVRVAVTDSQATSVQQAGHSYWEIDNTNHLFVLKPQNGELVQTGAFTNFANRESIFSVRFVGHRGYVVTFRRTDPLFVFDLSDPTNPSMLGEVEIPGFSEYMHPIDDNLLLTIGQVNNNLQLQIFDVSDPRRPQQRYVHVFEGEYGFSEAQNNHKAFTYYDSRNLLAFPYYSSYGTPRSTLKLFDIKKDEGIFLRGTIDHSDLFSDWSYGYCGGYFGIGVRRGLFLDDYVYSISHGGVKVHQIDNLNTEAGPTLSLPNPTNTSSCGGYYADTAD